VSLFVRRLLIQLNNPEELLFLQGDESKDIYFIAKGSVFVSIQDTAHNSYDNFRELFPGDHFGEISMIYNCPRTATVTSSNYCTFARLPKESYDRLV
jgi:CRP-like cAMP-binding protein